MTSGIYLIANQENGKVYIGSSKDIERRFKEHKKALKSGTHHNKHLQRSYTISGPDKFSYSIIYRCEENLIEKEREFIKLYNAMEDGYNTRDPRNVAIKACKEETKKKLSEALKEYYRVIPHNNKGRKYSDERKKKLSESKKNKGGKPVLAFRVGEAEPIGTYETATLCAEALGLDKKRVHAVLAGKKYGTKWKCKSHKGYRFEYINNF